MAGKKKVEFPRLPESLDSASLSEILKFSAVERRRIQQELARALSSLWPQAHLDEEPFYDVLLKTLTSESGYRAYTKAARKVGKKKKSLELGPTILRKGVRKYRNHENYSELSEQFDDAGPGIPFIFLGWLLDNDFDVEASALRWALVADFRDSNNWDFAEKLLKEVNADFPEKLRSDDHDLSAVLTYSGLVELLKAKVSSLDTESIDLSALAAISNLTNKAAELAEAEVERKREEETETSSRLAALEELVGELPGEIIEHLGINSANDIEPEVDVQAMKELMNRRHVTLEERSRLWEVMKRESPSAEIAGQYAAVAAEFEKSHSDLISYLTPYSESKKLEPSPKPVEVPLLESDPTIDEDSLVKKLEADSTEVDTIQDNSIVEGSGNEESSGYFDEPATLPHPPENDYSELEQHNSREILDDSEHQQKFNAEKHEHTDLLELVERGNLARAFWYSFIADLEKETQSNLTWNLGAVAETLNTDPGATTSRAVVNFLSKTAVNGEAEFDPILAAASMIPASLIMRNIPERTYAWASEPRTGIPQIDKLIISVVENFVNRYRFLDASDLDFSNHAEANNAEIQRLQQEAREFQERIPVLRMTFETAACGFRDAFEPGRDLHRLLTAIKTNKTSDRDWVEDYLERHSVETMFSEVENLSRKSLKIKKSKTLEIQGAARKKIVYHLEQISSFAYEWLSILEGQVNDKSGEERQAIQKLLPELKSALMEAIDALKPRSDLSSRISIQAFKAVVRILEGGGKQSRSTQSELARIKGLEIAENWTPAVNRPLVEMLAIVRSSDDAKDSDLVDSFILSADLSRARHVAATSYDAEREALLEKVDLSLAGQQKILEERVYEVETLIEENFRLGLFTDADREADSPLVDSDTEVLIDNEFKKSASIGSPDSIRAMLTGKVAEARRLLKPSDKPDNILFAKEILDSVQRMVEEKKQARKASLFDLLDKLLQKWESGATEEQDDAEYLREKANEFGEQDDVIALDELLEQAREAQSQRRRLVRLTPITNFELRRYVEWEEQHGKDRTLASPGRVSNHIRKGENFSGLLFGDKDKDYLTRTSSAVTAWNELRACFSESTKAREKMGESVATILRFLGFAVDSPNKSDWIAIEGDFGLLSVKVKGAVSASKVPIFGSFLANTNLNIMICKAKHPEREIAEFLKQKLLQRRPVIILHLLNANENFRLKFRQHCYDRHLSALLLDFSLLVYAASTRDPMPALFDIGLPYIWSQPYLMKGERVPKELFFGRDEEIRGVLEVDGSCVVYGGRQLGKSALLRHVQSEYHNPEQGVYVIYCDIDHLGTDPQTHFEMERELWRKITDELKLVGFLEESMVPKVSQKRFPSECMNLVKSRLREADNVRVLVLLDEADDFLDLDSSRDFSIISQMRGLISETNGKFKPVFSGLQSVQRYHSFANHPFAHLSGDKVVVQPLSVRSAQSLVQMPLAALGFEFENQALVLRILSQTNYHPGLVQIFCYRLLENLYAKVDSTKNPVRIISLADIQAVERDAGFMEDIRNRFDWTLDLDERYKVLIYALINENDPTGTHDLQKFIEIGHYWWPSVFDVTDRDTTKAILVELVGLGVLVQETDGNLSSYYRLRSPNLLRLLGSSQEIVTELFALTNRERPRKANPRNFRSYLGKSDPMFGPLTMEQGAALAATDRPFRLTMILGSNSLGLDSAPIQIREKIFKSVDESGRTWKEIALRSEMIATGSAKVIDHLHDNMKNRNRDDLYSIFDWAGMPATEKLPDFVRNCVERLSKDCRKLSQGHVVVMLDADASWEWLSSEARLESIETATVSELTLQRWSDGALSQALVDLDRRSKAKDHGESIFMATSGNFPLCLAVLKEANEGLIDDWSNGGLVSAVGAEKWNALRNCRIQTKNLAKAARMACEWSEGKPVEWNSLTDWVAENSLFFEESDGDAKVVFRKWLRAIGLAGPSVRSSDSESLLISVDGSVSME